MNAVVTVNLGNNAYQLDAKGHEKLRAYLDAAERALEGNPDKAEIIADLETAIGEKCTTYLNPHKTVVSENDVEEIIKEMGPVAPDTEESVEGKKDTAHSNTAQKSEKKAAKRFYRVREGAMLAGVCNGIAAYFDIDVSIVRIVFVFLIFVTSGAWILAYFVVALVTPAAETPKERAAASGVPPFTAQELVDRAKRGYADFKDSKEWRQWKHTLRENKRQWKHDMKNQYKLHHWYQQNYAKNNGYQRTWKDELVSNVFALIWLLVISYGLWFGYHHIPFIHNLMDQVPGAVSDLFDWMAKKMGN